MSNTSFHPWRYKLLIATGFVMLGCTVGPDYEKPETTLPQGWIAPDSNLIKTDGSIIQQNWWENFHDPVLNDLIVKASMGNFDLQIAEARIANARAARASADLGLLPTGEVKGAADRIAFPNDLALPGLSNPLNIYQAQFDASWELDLFGGQRRQIESASASLQASEASRDDVIISLMAEIARTYSDIRQFQAQLKIAQDTLEADSTTTNIARERFEAGQAPRFDARQAEAQTQLAQTQLPYYTNLLAQAEYSMDVLLGAQPGTAHSLVNKVEPIPTSDKQLILAAPASVIANRPDIRVAERKLAMMTAQQGVAVAKFFPDVSLSGFVGLLSTDAGNLLTVGSGTWLAGANIMWPILNYGTLSANLDAANAQQQEAMATYRKTIISALSDVERTVTAYIEQEKYWRSLEKSTKANQHVAVIAQQRYKEGLTSFLEVLDAQRTLYASQNQLIEAESKTTQNLIAVYKNLGGGWNVKPLHD
jgi:NodT family efflux transporter outer membrane factor (OMF) lipoprotein